MVCKTGACNSLGDTGNRTGEPGNTPEDVGNVPSSDSHSSGA